MSRITCLFLFVIYTSFTHLTHASSLVIEHVANAGVKVSSGDKSILIDALFGPHFRFNSLNNDDYATLVEQGAVAVMTSHYHSDHFGGKRAVRFLEKNPETLFIAPPQAYEQMANQVEHNLIKAPQLEKYHSVKYTHQGVTITVFNHPHMSLEQTADVQNFAYITEINGWKVLHIGDGEINEEIISKLKLDGYGIDVALLHDLCPEQPDCVERIQQIGAKVVGFYHMVDARAEPVGRWIKDHYPGARMLVTGQEPIVLSR